MVSISAKIAELKGMARQGMVELSHRLNNTENLVKVGKPLAVAIMVGGVAIGIFGIASFATGGFAAVVGAAAILTALPACYLGYNVHTVLTNLQKTGSKTLVFANQLLQGTELAREPLKQSLAKGTFFFDWAVSRFVDDIA